MPNHSRRCIYRTILNSAIIRPTETTRSSMATLTAMFNAADKTTPGYYGPSQTALLLIDYHSMFVQMPGGRDALKVAAEIRLWAKSQAIQVVHVLLDVDAAPYPTCKDPDKIAGFTIAMKASGGGGEPAELLEDDGDDVTFTRKPGQASALKSPGLDDFLQEKGIKSLVLAGLSTSGCVLRTSVTATDAEYVVSVISDGCADPIEGVHDMLVGKVLNNRGFVSTGVEFQQGYAKAISGQ
jgi:nicotinamidase-related amidase